MHWTDCGKLSRVINVVRAILFEPKSLGEFNSLQSRIPWINKCKLGVDTASMKYNAICHYFYSFRILLKHYGVSKPGATPTVFARLLSAVFDIENKEKLEAASESEPRWKQQGKHRWKESQQSKSEIPAMMSHELERHWTLPPLTDTLKSTQSTPEQQSILLNMSTSSELLLAIISGWPTSSKIEPSFPASTTMRLNVRDTVTLFYLNKRRRRR